MDPPSLSLPEGIPAIGIRISCNDLTGLATQDEVHTAGTIRTMTIE